MGKSEKQNGGAGTGEEGHLNTFLNSNWKENNSKVIAKFSELEWLKSRFLWLLDKLLFGL